MRDTPMIAAHGQGPLGGRSRYLFGSHPVDTIRKRGKANILAMAVPKRDQEGLKNCLLTLSLNSGLECSIST